jgi:hypothetical protein
MYSDISIIDLDVNLVDPDVTRIGTFGPGISVDSVSMSLCLRVDPSTEFEGFFVCRLKKGLIKK